MFETCLKHIQHNALINSKKFLLISVRFLLSPISLWRIGHDEKKQGAEVEIQRLRRAGRDGWHIRAPRLSPPPHPRPSFHAGLAMSIPPTPPPGCWTPQPWGQARLVSCPVLPPSHPGAPRSPRSKYTQPGGRGGGGCQPS